MGQCEKKDNVDAHSISLTSWPKNEEIRPRKERNIKFIIWRKEKSLKTTKRMDDQHLVLITLDLWRGGRHFCVYFMTLPILNQQGLGRLEVISQNLFSGTEKSRSTLQSVYVCDGCDSNHRPWNTKLGRHYFPILVGEVVEKHFI